MALAQAPAGPFSAPEITSLREFCGSATCREPWLFEMREGGVKTHDAELAAQELRDRRLRKRKKSEQGEDPMYRPTIEKTTINRCPPTIFHVIIGFYRVVIPLLVAVENLFQAPTTPE